MRRYALILVTSVAIALSACASDGSDDRSASDPTPADVTTTEAPAPVTTAAPEPSTSTNCPGPDIGGNYFGFPVEAEFVANDNTTEGEIFACSYVLQTDDGVYVEVVNVKKDTTGTTDQEYQDIIATFNDEYAGQEQLDPTAPFTVAQHDGHPLGTHIIGVARGTDAVCYAWYVGNFQGQLDSRGAVTALVMDACGI